jgi:dihydroorotate dehydrogenase|tara:strand:+ start:907 stop:1926 length:1020 start_codon:yes stop_codon:yes gene_type:complete
MYKLLIRPIFFIFNPEFIHNISLSLVNFLYFIPGIKFISKKVFCFEDDKLSFELENIKFKNKIGLAAGFDKNGKHLDVLETFGFGHVEVGTVTPKPQSGNEKPRLFRLSDDRALLNRMGFNNDGVEAVIKRLKKYKGKMVIGANIGKNKITSNEKAVDDYLFCFKKLRDYVDYFTINISSPNTPDLRELQSKSNLNILISQIQSENRKKSKIPVFIKIAPDLDIGEVEDIIKVCENHEINGIIATNTTISRDSIKNKKINQMGDGGISGRPISSKSNKIISYIKKSSRLKIIGVGGVFDINDFHNKIDSGADLVQVYTGWIYEGPGMIKRINKAILEIE